jgi:hypothetical protein
LISKEQTDLIINLYAAGESVCSISRETGLSVGCCKVTLTKSGVAIRSKRESTILSGRINRKYSMNEDFFGNIDNEKKAYWLGFISADGNINKTSNTLYIALKASDAPHLQKFLDDIEANYTITEFTSTGGFRQARVALTSYKMKRDGGWNTHNLRTIFHSFGLDTGDILRHLLVRLEA